MLETLLLNNQGSYAPVMPFDFSSQGIFIFDLTENNTALANTDLSNTEAFTNYIFDELKKNNTPVGIGKYNEDRIIYSRSKVFDQSEPRSIHLGIDIWAEPHTPVYAPLDGMLHSFKNNDAYGDYGPTLILEHSINGVAFYTLYGHLSTESLSGKEEGMRISKGNKIATLGTSRENVEWPPHLHFQIIKDLQGKKGDFYGVCAPSERTYYTALCPDPNLILNIKKLK